MPHHWKPIEPGNPDAEGHLGEVVDYLGEGVKFAGRAREDKLIWTLLDATDDEIRDLEARGLLRPDHKCSRTLDEISPGGEAG
jgi:hypothetical protein